MREAERLPQGAVLPAQDSLEVLAVGARTPLGLSAASSAAAVRAGVSRLLEHPYMVDRAGNPLRCAVDIAWDDARLAEQAAFGAMTSPPANGGEVCERLLFLVLEAIRDALWSLIRHPNVWDLVDGIHVLLTLPECRPGFSEGDRQQVLERVRRSGLPKLASIQTVAQGHAGGLATMGYALSQTSSWGNSLVVIVGAESYFDADTIDWLEASGRLDREDIRSGFSPGEAAGALVFSTGRQRQRFGLLPGPALRGAGIAEEQIHIAHAKECLGLGLSSAVGHACSGLRLPQEAVDGVLCDINGERYRSEEWGFCLLRNHHVCKHSDYLSAVDCWADTGAASGVLNGVLAYESWRRGYAPGPRQLIWGSSDGGLRAAVVLEDCGHGRGVGFVPSASLETDGMAVPS